MRAALATAAAAAALLSGAAAAPEKMCNGVPCSLTGCGGPDGKGVWGQKPCFPHYPRTCQFAFRSNAATLEEDVAARRLPKLKLPPVSAFTGPQARPLHDASDDPLVLASTGELLHGCSVKSVRYVRCEQDLRYRDVECDALGEYPYLQAYESAPEGAADPIVPLARQFEMTGDERDTLGVMPISDSKVITEDVIIIIIIIITFYI
jgi:hypothetical protein